MPPARLIVKTLPINFLYTPLSKFCPPDDPHNFPPSPTVYGSKFFWVRSGPVDSAHRVPVEFSPVDEQQHVAIQRVSVSFRFVYSIHGCLPSPDDFGVGKPRAGYLCFWNFDKLVYIGSYLFFGRLCTVGLVTAYSWYSWLLRRKESLNAMGIYWCKWISFVRKLL